MPGPARLSRKRTIEKTRHPKLMSIHEAGSGAPVVTISSVTSGGIVRFVLMNTARSDAPDGEDGSPTISPPNANKPVAALSAAMALASRVMTICWPSSEADTTCEP